MKNKSIILIALLIAVVAGFFIYNNLNGMKKSEEENNIEGYGEQVETENETVEVVSQEVEIDTEKEREEKIAKYGKLSSDGLPVFMYHFFYDKSQGEVAKDGNYLEISTFEGHLQYLTEEDFYFPSWEEVSDYIDGSIDLPAKSVVLTVDDGEESFFRLAYPVIQKYDVKVTEFLVGAWNGWFKDDYPAKQMVYQSHSYDMHKAGSDGKGVIMTWSYDQILADVTQSRDELGEQCITFCYPFGHYNDTVKRALKAAGYKLAFTTEYGRARKGMDKLALPRVRTSSSTSVEVLKNLVK